VSDLSEKEQIDEFRAWWKENGWYVIGGLILGIGLMVGWNTWQGQRAGAYLQASTLYESLVAEVADGQLEPAEKLATDLFAQYEDTPYAAQGRLAMARLYMDRGRDQDAADVLQPLAASKGDDALQLIARLRLAKVLLYQDKPQQVLDLLGTPGDNAFAARYYEMIGDARFALGDVAAAVAAYTAVLADPRASQTVDTRFVRMKLDDLPDAGKTASAGDADLPPDEATE
jgi:predicted negative regulator of RcsB-dependent stress response